MSFLRARASYLIWSGLLLLLGLVGLGAFLAVHSIQMTRTWVTQSHEVINSTKDLLADALDAEMSQRGYLITGNRAYLLPYEQVTERITVTLSKLRQLTSDNPDQLHNLDQLAGSIERKMQELARTIELRTSLGIAAANAVIETDINRNIMGEIRAGLSAITTEEERLFQDRLAEMDRSQRLAHTSIATGAILAFGLIGFGGWTLRRANALRRLAEAGVAATAAELSTSFNSLSQGVAVFDAAWRLVRWNSGWATLLGLPFDNMRTGIDYSNLTRMVEPGFLEAEEQISRNYTQAAPVIFERTRPDGQVFELRRTTLPGGGFVLTCANITVRTRMAQAIQEAERMQAIGHLTGAVAHDFNNYLTIILGNLDFA